MLRREFIALIGGAASWPLDVRAQRDERARRIGILWRGDVTEGVVQAQQGALREELAKLGWSEGPNVQFDVRYSADDPARIRTHANELVGLAPDVIAASSFAVARAVLQRTRTIPIVFVNVGDPVAGGLLKNIARPNCSSCSRRRRRAPPGRRSSSLPKTSMINSSTGSTPPLKFCR